MLIIDLSGPHVYPTQEDGVDRRCGLAVAWACVATTTGCVGAGALAHVWFVLERGRNLQVCFGAGDYDYD